MKHLEQRLVCLKNSHTFSGSGENYSAENIMLRTERKTRNDFLSSFSYYPAKSSDYRVSRSWTSLLREIKAGVPLLGIFRED